MLFQSGKCFSASILILSWHRKKKVATETYMWQKYDDRENDQTVALICKAMANIFW